MRTVSPYGKIAPLYIKDDYCPSLPLNYLSAARRYITCKGYPQKIGHLLYRFFRLLCGFPLFGKEGSGEIL